jgi:hypothetical protein
MFAVLALFHLLIIVGVIPYKIVWGGRLKNQLQMLGFELVSLTILLIAGVVVAEKIACLHLIGIPFIINTSLWLFLCLFALNTIGNLVAKTRIERYFSLITIIISILLALLIFTNSHIV